MFKNLEAIGRLTEGIGQLTKVTTDLVDLTRAMHREHSIALMQAFEEAKGEDNILRKNFDMAFIQMRLEALLEATGGAIKGINSLELPSLVQANGAEKVY